MKILIVDDSKTMRRILKSGIEKSCDMELEILEAEDGKVGLDVVRANKDINYIFLDVNMPVMKGDEMLRILRSEDGIKDIPVIMQTTEGAKEMVLTLTKLGIAGYLLKPYTQDIVRDLMSKLIEHEVA
jgi:two-component system chemotaxis response regulator CheY